MSTAQKYLVCTALDYLGKVKNHRQVINHSARRLFFFRELVNLRLNIEYRII